MFIVDDFSIAGSYYFSYVSFLLHFLSHLHPHLRIISNPIRYSRTLTLRIRTSQLKSNHIIRESREFVCERNKPGNRARSMFLSAQFNASCTRIARPMLWLCVCVCVASSNPHTMNWMFCLCFISSTRAPLQYPAITPSLNWGEESGSIAIDGFFLLCRAPFAFISCRLLENSFIRQRSWHLNAVAATTTPPSAAPITMTFYHSLKWETNHFPQQSQPITHVFHVIFVSNMWLIKILEGSLLPSPPRSIPRFHSLCTARDRIQALCGAVYSTDFHACARIYLQMQSLVDNFAPLFELSVTCAHSALRTEQHTVFFPVPILKTSVNDVNAKFAP